MMDGFITQSIIMVQKIKGSLRTSYIIIELIIIIMLDVTFYFVFGFVRKLKHTIQLMRVSFNITYQYRRLYSYSTI